MISVLASIERVKAAGLEASVFNSVYTPHLEVTDQNYFISARLGIEDKKNQVSIEIVPLPYYCGGVFLCGLSLNYYSIPRPKETYDDVAIKNSEKLFKVIFDILTSQNNTFVTYISTNKQLRVNSVLEAYGFTRTATVINPNSNNTAYHWYLDLSKK